MNAGEPLHDLIEIRAAAPLAIVATVAGEAVSELWLFPAGAAAARAAYPDVAARPDVATSHTARTEVTARLEDTAAHPLLREVRRQLEEYFDGARRVFDLPLAPRGTEFERRVWQEVAAIPYGETRSYAEIARAAGRPDACRAVGRANGRNPIPLVIPCHRVIGSDGSLTGFGGGLPLKRFLLALEGAAPARRAAPSPQLGLPLVAVGEVGEVGGGEPVEPVEVIEVGTPGSGAVITQHSPTQGAERP